MPEQFADIPFRTRARSRQLNAVLQLLTGANDDSSGLPYVATPNGRWAWTGPSARVSLVKNTGDTLVDLNSFSNETVEGQLTLVSGSESVLTAKMTPQLVAQTFVKPNQTQYAFGEAGANWLFKTKRKGTGKQSDHNGDLEALYSLCSVAYDDSDYRDFIYGDVSYGHDIVAIAGLAKALMVGDPKGGTVRSSARAYAGYFESEALSYVAQAIGIEAQAVNSTGVTAALLESAPLGYQLAHVGIQLVSQLGLSRGGKFGSQYNSAALFITSSNPGDPDYAWLRGLEFNTGSIAPSHVAIDMHRLTYLQVPIRLQNSGVITARTTTPGVDVNVLRVDNGNNLELFAAQNFRFKNGDGTTEFMRITTTGLLDFKNGQNFGIVAGTPATLATVGGTNRPAAPVQIGWLKMQSNDVDIWVPYWV